MSIILLRKMTLKSIIGFGHYADLRVQELIQMNKEKDLLQMYYRLGGIDFDDTVKEMLCITKERQIPKPGKDYDLYIKNVYSIIKDIMERNTANNPDGLETRMYRKESYANKKHEIVRSKIATSKDTTKIRNMRRNQGKPL